MRQMRPDEVTRDDRLVLLVADRVRTLDSAAPSPPGMPVRAVLVRGERIAWVGADPDGAPVPTDADVERRDLAGAVLQPAFVDAHVHLTATGLALAGLDLHDCHSVEDCLAAVRAVSDVLPGRVIIGTGWDDVHWPEGRPPHADELSRAGGGRPVLLERADGHSAVVDVRSLDAAPFARSDGVERDPSGRPTGMLRREAHHVARRWFYAEVPQAQLAEARAMAAHQAATLGIGSVHEMAGPDLMGSDDFDAWRTGDWPVEVIGYWGAPDLDFAVARGLRQIGGDIFLDGTLGSRTAALEADYADGRTPGHLYEETDDLVTFVISASARRLQVGFHAIGDAAVRQAATILDRAAGVVGRPVLRSLRPRIEHCSLVPADVVPLLADLGVVASVQPAFDRAWGGPGGLYERRLGPDRLRRTHPLRELADAGVTLALGSDSTVTPMDPWAMVDAATRLQQPVAALDDEAALRAAVVGGRAAARQDDVGRVRVGDRADLAAFEGPDGRGRCVLTMVRGLVVHGDAGVGRAG
jgi:predicted amidohydrolase YtcJ